MDRPFQPTPALYQIPQTKIESRTINPENRQALKGQGAQKQEGRKGEPCEAPLQPFETRELANYDGGPGVIRHLWMTSGQRNSVMLRSLRLDFYWDGSSTPAISVPMGDFFGHALGEMIRFDSALFASAEARNGSCFIPMPFRKSFRLTITNETEREMGGLFWHIDLTIGDDLPEDLLYFHAYFNRENPTTKGVDYTLVPQVYGKGRYLGVSIGARADTDAYLDTWWGEGEFKAYVDGDKDFPTIVGTGTEDYIATAWGQGRYIGQHYGCGLADEKNMRYGFYRYHLIDPIYFYEDFRCAIQQIGCIAPESAQKFLDLGRELTIGSQKLDLQNIVDEKHYCVFDRTDDWSSCAYLYLNRPDRVFPDIMSVEDRTKDLMHIEGAARQDA